MPKVVDPQLRRTELAEAVWRVIRRDSLEQASVRNVAQEAGLSAGSLRHYFGSQSELMVFAMRMVIDRIEQRIEQRTAALGAECDPLQRAETVVAELLPLDAERRAENEVWLAFTARSITDPTLRALREESYDRLRDGCRGLVSGLIGPGRDLELEAARLHALVDGLAVHAAMRPDTCTAESMHAAITVHLSELRPES